MRLADILEEVGRKQNSFSNASLILTRSREALKILENEAQQLTDPERTERYNQAVSTLKNVQQLYDAYAATVDHRMENGSGIAFAELANSVYNALDGVVNS